MWQGTYVTKTSCDLSPGGNLKRSCHYMQLVVELNPSLSSAYRHCGLEIENLLMWDVIIKLGT